MAGDTSDDIKVFGGKVDVVLAVGGKFDVVLAVCGKVDVVLAVVGKIDVGLVFTFEVVWVAGGNFIVGSVLFNGDPEVVITDDNFDFS